MEAVDFSAGKESRIKHMKTLLVTLNAKYIHKALALRLLYVASKPQHDVCICEYTIKDSVASITADLLAKKAAVIAFSCYIWNIEMTKAICAALKKQAPSLVLILGGPEVSYEPAYFLAHTCADYIMSGEGEITFPQLLSCIEKKERAEICGVSYRGAIAKDIAQTPLSFIEQLESPYALPQDEEAMGKRILYFETSRGCPYQCQYCLSSLEKGMRFFSLPYLYHQLDLIFQSEAKTIKVLDRSFNANPKHALAILDYIVSHHAPHQQFQFEINADVFPQSLIDFINTKAPKGLFRFEIGIQSTYEPANRAIARMQDFTRLQEVVKALMQGDRCELHLDLIAGLPYESYDRFAKSFDDVFAFRAKELQLGFLKLLRGTSLRKDAKRYGYRYEEKAPYAMIENQWMSQEEVQNIHLAEDMLEKYWNSGRFSHTMKAVLDQEPSPFAFFYRLGCYYKAHQFAFHRYQLYDLFVYLDAFLQGAYRDVMIMDYLLIAKTRPKRWYPPTLTREEWHAAISFISTHYHISQDLLYRYARIERLGNHYAVAIYRNLHCDWKLYPIEEEKWRFQPCKDQDLETALSLYASNRAYFELCGEKLPTLHDVAKDQRLLPPGCTEDQKQYGLLYEGSTAIALLDGIKDYPLKHTYYIGLFLVDGNRHRQGYGKSAYEALEMKLKAQGYRKIRLAVIKENQKAAMFWKAMGFQVKQKISKAITMPHKEIMIMEKELR